jgi:hypothetical protein
MTAMLKRRQRNQTKIVFVNTKLRDIPICCAEFFSLLHETFNLKRRQSHSVSQCVRIRAPVILPVVQLTALHFYASLWASFARK